ncbi:MAG: hypothetical protein GY861_21615 [bacterium]|nr:hypothetical protein [bacterium]
MYKPSYTSLYTENVLNVVYNDLEFKFVLAKLGFVGNSFTVEDLSDKRDFYISSSGNTDIVQCLDDILAQVTLSTDRIFFYD